MEAAETCRVVEFARIQDENAKLKGKLQDNQTNIEALANDNTTLTAKVPVLEARA